MDPNNDLQNLIAEGKKYLEAGDKTHALAYFVTASELEPEDENLWLLCAQAAEDPRESVDCLEHVLAINPQNAQARDKLLSLRLDSLQQEARETTQGARFQAKVERRSFLNFKTVALAAVLFGTLVGLGLIGFGIFSRTSAGSGSASPGDGPVAIAVATLPVTWTPKPQATLMPTYTPLPFKWKILRDVNVRLGPGTNFDRLGFLAKDFQVTILGRTQDGRYLQIAYGDSNQPGWIPVEYVDINSNDKAGLAVVSNLPSSPTIVIRPTQTPTAKPTNLPAVQVDFGLGRPIETATDCSGQWKVAGTIYSAREGAQRINGILVRLSAFGQVQGTVSSGNVDYSRPGYWEWSFNRGSDIMGDVAIVNPDGTLRSLPISFHLTSACGGSNTANQIFLDFVGVR